MKLFAQEKLSDGEKAALEVSAERLTSSSSLPDNGVSIGNPTLNEPPTLLWTVSNSLGRMEANQENMITDITEIRRTLGTVQSAVNENKTVISGIIGQMKGWLTAITVGVAIIGILLIEPIRKYITGLFRWPKRQPHENNKVRNKSDDILENKIESETENPIIN